MKKNFRWNIEDIIKALVGSLIYCFAINMFIVPNNLFTGGIMGISQLLRTFLTTVLKLKFPFDISGVLYYIINIPLFIFAYKKVSKNFFYRSLICVSFQTLMLSLIKSPSTPLVDNILANVLIGGILTGIGAGLTLSSGASTGGTDIIGVLVSKDNNEFSVGKLALIINVITYSLTGIMHGVEIMIYSILDATFDSLALDRFHTQNICSSAILFCKDDTKNIKKFIKEELGRDYTYWDAYGGYDNSKTHIIYTAASKHELERLERYLKYHDEKIFMVKSEGVGIKGSFKKKF